MGKKKEARKHLEKVMEVPIRLGTGMAEVHRNRGGLPGAGVVVMLHLRAVEDESAPEGMFAMQHSNTIHMALHTMFSGEDKESLANAYKVMTELRDAVVDGIKEIDDHRSKCRTMLLAAGGKINEEEG